MANSMNDFAERMQRVLDVFAVFMQEAQPMFQAFVEFSQQLLAAVYQAYQAAGMPYGDDHEGMMRWLRETHETQRLEQEAAFIRQRHEMLAFVGSWRQKMELDITKLNIVGFFSNRTHDIMLVINKPLPARRVWRGSGFFVGPRSYSFGSGKTLATDTSALSRAAVTAWAELTARRRAAGRLIYDKPICWGTQEMLKLALIPAMSWAGGLAIVSALQGVIPSGMEAFFTQVPFVAVIVGLIVMGQKWYAQNEERWQKRFDENNRVWRDILEQEHKRSDTHAQHLVNAFESSFNVQSADNRIALEKQTDMFVKTMERIYTIAKQQADRIEILTQQVAMNTATVGEFGKLDDFVDRLMAIWKSRGGEEG